MKIQILLMLMAFPLLNAMDITQESNRWAQLPPELQVMVLSKLDHQSVKKFLSVNRESFEARPNIAALLPSTLRLPLLAPYARPAQIGHNQWLRVTPQIAPDGSFFITSENVYDSKTGKIRFEIESRSFIEPFAITPDSNFIVTHNNEEDGDDIILDALTGEFVRALKGLHEPTEGIIISLDQKYIFIVEEFNEEVGATEYITVYDFNTGTLLYKLNINDKYPNKIVLAPNNQFIVTTHYDVSDPEGRDRYNSRIFDLTTLKFTTVLDDSHYHMHEVKICHDSKLIITASHNNAVASVWCSQIGTLLCTLRGHNGGIIAIRLFSDGKFAITLSYDKTVKKWNLATGECLYTINDNCTSVNLSHDNQCIITGSDNYMIKMWDAITSHCILVLSAKAEVIDTVKISLDNNTIITHSAFSYDTIVKTHKNLHYSEIWDISKINTQHIRDLLACRVTVAAKKRGHEPNSPLEELETPTKIPKLG